MFKFPTFFTPDRIQAIMDKQEFIWKQVNVLVPYKPSKVLSLGNSDSMIDMRMFFDQGAMDFYLDVDSYDRSQYTYKLNNLPVYPHSMSDIDRKFDFIWCFNPDKLKQLKHLYIGAIKPTTKLIVFSDDPKAIQKDVADYLSLAFAKEHKKEGYYLCTFVPKIFYSFEYYMQLTEAHKTEGWNAGKSWEQHITEFCRRVGARSVLDFGCGKGSLQREMKRRRIQWFGYDPGVPEFSKMPKAKDVVVCTDVMEHCEPEYLDSLILQIAKLGKRGVFFNIATDASKTFLPDGRNAHLIQEDYYWWLKRLKHTGYWKRITEVKAKAVTLICEEPTYCWEL